jgi:hypothetical protein
MDQVVGMALTEFEKLKTRWESGSWEGLTQNTKIEGRESDET